MFVYILNSFTLFKSKTILTTLGGLNICLIFFLRNFFLAIDLYSKRKVFANFSHKKYYKVLVIFSTFKVCRVGVRGDKLAEFLKN